MTESRKRGWRRRVVLCGDDSLIADLILHGLSVFSWEFQGLHVSLLLNTHHGLLGLLRYIHDFIARKKLVLLIARSSSGLHNVCSAIAGLVVIELLLSSNCELLALAMKSKSTSGIT